MNIAFLNQYALIQRETISALRRLPGVRIITIDSAMNPSPEQVARMVSLCLEHHCSVIITINEWGMDDGGVLWQYCTANRILHVNWSVDDPFYEEIMHHKKFRPSPMRIDFVSDRGYVDAMTQRGYAVHFLPLAADLSIFNPYPESEVHKFENDVVFVGNSYIHQIDGFLRIAPDFIDLLTPFLGDVVSRYLDDVTFSVEETIQKKIRSLKIPPHLTLEKAVFIAKHAAGYFGRKRMIKTLVERFSGFKVYGEPGWLRELPAERLGTAKYYDSLCAVYRKSRICIDINRMVIRNGFTQRVFDSLASGSFVLTSAKPVVEEYFVTKGEKRELAVFHNLQELVSLTNYYLVHEEERRAAAARGRMRVIADHTYEHRIAAMFGVIAQHLHKQGQVSADAPAVS